MVPRWRTAGSPIRPARWASAGMLLLHHRRGRDLDVRRHRADDERAARHLDAGQAFDLGQVDEMLRPGEAQLHRRDQRVAAGQELCFFLLGQQARGLPHGRRPVLGECVHRDAPYAALASAVDLLQCLPHRLCGRRHRQILGADRVGDGVDHRRRRRDRARLAAALDAERVRRRFRRGHVDLERRQIVRPRHAVIHQRAGDELTVLVIDHAFEQRLADALRDAAVDLALDDHRIDDGAEIIDRGPRDDLALAGLRDRPRPRRYGNRPGR